MKGVTMKNDLTKGNVLQILVRFSLPYLLSCFLQTFYGLADLFITGQFNGTATISAVSIGSQVMHMLTVIIVGLAMGSTVTISQAVGAKREERAARAIGNTVILFLFASAVLTFFLILFTDAVTAIMSTPVEAVSQTRLYLRLCFAGIPAITAYNIICCIFRGMGDSKSPMYFVAAACALNILLDYLFIGLFHMGAAGAALGTVLSQAASVLLALSVLCRRGPGFPVGRKDFRINGSVLSSILRIGVPVAFQDGFIQISFLLITIIANRRGVTVAAGVGIVEKTISFLFLVPSAMLSSISAIAAQNAGAGEHGRARQTLRYGILIAVSFGAIAALFCQFFSESVLGLFSSDPEVIRLGGQYLRSYVFDCMAAGVHFCFSGYFCAYGKAFFSFLHNLASILLIRIPGACLASVCFPDNLWPMGLAAPAGSALSALICLILYLVFRQSFGETAPEKEG